MIPQSRPTLLMTRPLAQSRRFAAELAQRFGPLDCVISPLIAPEFLPSPPAPPCMAVIFTSETGVEGAEKAGIWANTPRPDLAFCVGARTASAAQAQGFRTKNAGGDWHNLVQLIAGQMAPSPLLFAAAAEAPAHLQTALQAVGFTLHRCDVYRQNPQPLTPQAQHLLNGADPILLPLFSPRSAQLFCAAAPATSAPLWLATLSPQISAAFTAPFARQVVAHRPNSAALLDAMQELLQIPPMLSPLP